MFDRFKAKAKNYTAKFLQTEGDRYVLIGSQKFNIEDKLIKFKDKQFIVDSKILGFVEKNKTNVFFDFEQQRQLSFREIKSSYNAKLIDQLLRTKESIYSEIGKIAFELRALDYDIAQLKEKLQRLKNNRIFLEKLQNKLEKEGEKIENKRINT